MILKSENVYGEEKYSQIRNILEDKIYQIHDVVCFGSSIRNLHSSSYNSPSGDLGGFFIL